MVSINRIKTFFFFYYAQVYQEKKNVFQKTYCTHTHVPIHRDVAVVWRVRVCRRNESVVMRIVTNGVYWGSESISFCSSDDFVFFGSLSVSLDTYTLYVFLSRPSIYFHGGTGRVTRPRASAKRQRPRRRLINVARTKKPFWDSRNTRTHTHTHVRWRFKQKFRREIHQLAW